ncbi:MAG TPA: HDOD domain-containing protein [Acidisarcina sp.]|nr:HDOD domain-containing protein [Acidisarcina sp.]
MLQIAPARDDSTISVSELPQHRFFARQPILDRNRKIFGYEFLFRSSMQNKFPYASPTESDYATRLMVDNSILYNFESLAGRGKAFLNCTREALTQGFVTLLPPQSTVLEVLEGVEPDNEVVDACRSLRSQGYQISLDDFIPRPGMERLLPYADYIKFDFRLCNAAQRAEIRQFVKGSKSLLVAEKVEDEEAFRLALEEGFDLFQGYFFCQPSVFSRKKVSSQRLRHLKLLTAVSRSPFNWHEIESIVRKDASLCYRLLRLVNAGHYMVRSEISSIQTALVTVGEDRFRKLLTLAVTSQLDNDPSSELTRLALQRARFCEMAAPYLQQDPNEQYLFGLLSLFPAFMGISMQQAITQLPLRPPVKAALLGEPNEISFALRCLHRYESGEWNILPEDTANLALNMDTLDILYQHSLCWAENSTSSAAQ